MQTECHWIQALILPRSQTRAASSAQTGAWVGPPAYGSCRGCPVPWAWQAGVPIPTAGSPQPLLCLLHPSPQEAPGSPGLTPLGGVPFMQPGSQGSGFPAWPQPKAPCVPSIHPGALNQMHCVCSVITELSSLVLQQSPQTAQELLPPCPPSGPPPREPGPLTEEEAGESQRPGGPTRVGVF